MKKIKTTYIKYSIEDFNNLIQLLDETNNLKSTFSKIDESIVEYNSNEYSEEFEEGIINDEYLILLKPLTGFKIKYKRNGEHKSDYQIVEYVITLKSPAGNETKINTEMNLVNGWDFSNDNNIIKIKK